MLHLHRAERADGLAAALAGLLAQPLEDPLAADVVAVPTRGMERWLAQRLSGHLGASEGRADGVCANVEFPPPGRLIAEALAAAADVEPEEDPWLPDRITWPLLEVVETHLAEPWLRSLAVYLGSDPDDPQPDRRTRRLSTVRHFAELFHRYGVHRPEMVCAWAAGSDGDGEGGPLPAPGRWQAELWRRLRERLGAPSPAERLGPACARLRGEPGLLGLPSRLALFGLTRLPAGHLEVLRALAAGRDVHLFLLHPSPALWAALAPVAAAPGARRCRRREDPTAQLAHHPLLASWGRDTRELQLVLAGGETAPAHHHAQSSEARTLLARLQAGVRADQAPPGRPAGGAPDLRPLLEPADASVQVHACHGRARQVEVLRDAVLQLLAADPTLEPRDVIVMCPDIEAFAPLIHATFGAGEEDEEGDLRVRLADRSLRQTNPVLAAVAALLELVGERVTASQVLSFADREPVRRRFGLRDEDLARLQRWIADAGIRWGLDAAHRAPFKLSALAGGTWQRGLDRLLLGVAMTEQGSRLFGGALPLDDVESGAIELAGRLAELIARLTEALDALGRPQPLGAWATAIATATDALTATGGRESWQRGELQRILDELVAEATAPESERPLEPAEVRALLAERLAGRPTRANFRTGHLTVCTLYPMRSVPHRVVCLLGLDDGAFPRRSPRDGDDLLLDDPRVGERDPRSEDRQLLLDALMAAGERLLVIYTGSDERTNLPRPPAVPVGELLDVIDATVRVAAGEARDHVLTRHPLQPFDRRNFLAGALVPERPWSFDAVMLAGARSLSAPRSAPTAFLEAPLPAPEAQVIALEDLVRFLQFPVRAFLRQRLRVYLGEIEDEVQDGLPVELDGLERWGVGQRLLEAARAGTDGRIACLAEIARGTLPPGALGAPVVRDLYPVVERIAACAREHTPAQAEPRPLDVHATLPDGRLLSGTLPELRGEVLLSATFSRVAAKHRLAAWVGLLAATATAPELALSALTVGRGERESVRAVRIAPLADETEARSAVAMAELAVLIDLYDRGLREPLPLFCETSAAYVQALAGGDLPVPAARKKWESGYRYDGEDRELDHQLVYGGQRRFEELMAEPPRPDEAGPGWRMSEPSRLGRLAGRLWEGLLAREEITSW